MSLLSKKPYKVAAYWAARKEDIGQCAERAQNLFQDVENWLGKPIWEVVKTNKSIIKNLKDKCDIKEHDNEVLQIISENECFTESSGIEIQEKLKDTIYFDE